jgi:hypothetical protein
VDLIGSDLRQPQPVRRPVEVLGELRDRVHVATLCCRRQVADLHVLTMRRRSGFISAIDGLLQG